MGADRKEPDPLESLTDEALNERLSSVSAASRLISEQYEKNLRDYIAERPMACFSSELIRLKGEESVFQDAKERILFEKQRRHNKSFQRR